MLKKYSNYDSVLDALPQQFSIYSFGDVHTDLEPSSRVALRSVKMCVEIDKMGA